MLYSPDRTSKWFQFTVVTSVSAGLLFSPLAFAHDEKEKLDAAADKDFFHPEVRFSRAIQELDIEAEAVGLRRLKDGTENIEAKRLEAALRVPKWKTGREPDDEIEYATALFSSPGLTKPDQTPI